jgi:hypothetical protein
MDQVVKHLPGKYQDLSSNPSPAKKKKKKNTHKIYHQPFWWDLCLNSGLCTCKADSLPIEPNLQSILLWLFLKIGSGEQFVWAGLEPQSSQAAMITGVNHWCPTTINHF